MTTFYETGLATYHSHLLGHLLRMFFRFDLIEIPSNCDLIYEFNDFVFIEKM